MTDHTPTPMSDESLNAFLDNELRNTIGYGHGGDRISEERAKNLEMYLNRPVGDEQEGRSKVQSSAVHDTIELLLPSTLAPFISAESVCEVVPVGLEDAEYAKQAAGYLNHIFMVDNDGMKIQYQWQKDGLLQKNGFVYADWVMRERTERKAQRVAAPGFFTLANDPEIEIIKYAGFIDGRDVEPALLESLVAAENRIELERVEFEVDYRRTYKEGRVKIQNIPPEHMVIGKSAKDEETSPLIGFREKVTLSNLREEGYDEELIAKLTTGAGDEHDPANERTIREEDQGGSLAEAIESNDPSNRLVWRSVLLARVDYDGDGKAELRKIIRAGSNPTGGTILYNEEADEVTIVSFTPVPMPHQLMGRCPADEAREAQEAETAMLRMAMDATYKTVYNRWAVIEGSMSEDTWEDLMMDIPGAPVRMRAADTVRPLQDAPDIQAAYNMLEYWERAKERRTPVTRQDSGIDTDVLNNKSATQAKIQANAVALRKELILRIYAESLSKLMRIINRMVIKHQDTPRLIRLFPDRPPVEVDPRYWNADMDVRIRVGLGTGTRDQQLNALMTINQIQMADMQSGLSTVDPEKLYNTRARLVEYSGLSSPEMYFNRPQAPQDMPPQFQAILQQETQKAFEAGKAQSGADMKAAELQFKREELQIEQVMQDKELALKQQELLGEAAELRVRQEENRAQAMGFRV